MFFLYFGAMHALLEYYELTHDEQLRKAIVRFASDGSKGDIVDDRSSERGGPLMPLAFAARYAEDSRIGSVILCS